MFVMRRIRWKVKNRKGKKMSEKVCYICKNGQSQHEGCFPCPDPETPKLHPRNDNIVFRRTVFEKLNSGMIVSQKSIEAFQHNIVAIGSKVEDLKVGDRVEIVGTIGVDYDFITGSHCLMMCREKNVVLSYNDEPVDADEKYCHKVSER